MADEGAELRKQGITMPIMVMNPEMSSFHTLFRYDLEPEVYSFKLFDALLVEARRQGLLHYPVHIKIDSGGMHRLGFEEKRYAFAGRVPFVARYPLGPLGILSFCRER